MAQNDKVKVTVKCGDAFYTIIVHPIDATAFRDLWDDITCPEKIALSGTINDIEPNNVYITFKSEEISSVQIMELKE